MKGSLLKRLGLILMRLLALNSKECFGDKTFADVYVLHIWANVSLGLTQSSQ